MNTEYEIKFSENCKNKIYENYNYIKEVLCNERAAQKLMRKIELKILNLKFLPKMYAEINLSNKLKKKYRWMVIDNFIILYTIDEKNKIVYITKMYYRGQNYLN